MTAQTQSLPSRNEVAAEDTWDLTTIYADEAAWEADFAAVSALIPQLQALQGTIKDGPQALLKVFKLQEELWTVAEKVMAYSYLRGDEDTTNTHQQAIEERAKSLMTQASAAGAWVDPELLTLSDDELRAYLSREPELAIYARTIEELIRMRPHVRSAEIEELLAQAGEVARGPSTIFGNFVDADLQFPAISDENGNRIEVTQGRYVRLLESRDQRVRRDAFDAFHSTYRSYRNTLAATYAASVRGDVFYARAHGYASSLEASLKPHDIPLSVYDNLVATVRANAPKMHRYVRLRKKLLGVAELHTYDLFAPLNEAPQLEIGFDDAASLVLASTAPFGDEYSAALGSGLESRWIDRYENKGKRSGAYSGGAYVTNPFILMNYQNNLDSLFTLAHEIGHSMHSYFTRKSQPFVYGHYTLFVAEVASTLNEALLAEHMLKTSDDPALRFQLLTQQINDIRTTLFRQTLFAEFELEAHRMVERGEALTADNLSALYIDLIKHYYGPDLVIDENLDVEWARIPHFYRAFYVYQYSTGISAALALADRIKREGQPAADDYLSFLRGGSSKSSIDLLKGAGVDMTTPEPVQRAMDAFDGWMDQLEQLIA